MFEKRFTYPFCYTPDDEIIRASERLIAHIVTSTELHGIFAEGKMMGVLMVRDAEGNESFLYGFSGLAGGKSIVDGFVPPIFDLTEPDGYFKCEEAAISALNGRIRRLEETDPAAAAALKTERKSRSTALQEWLFNQYVVLNALGERKSILEIFAERGLVPPGGTGDCAAPKLLQYAYSHQLKPVCMAEFWWGPSPKSLIRHHGQFYPACRGKCKPILTWMLQGLDVDPDPEEAAFPCLDIEVVYEDEVMAVINKPSGLLSVPGKTTDYSVATIAKQRWPGALPVHRLDMGTSGLLVVAKTKEAYVALQAQFVKRTVGKRYIALIDGIPEKNSGRIDLPLANDPMNRPRQTVDHQKGKSAVTEYEVLETFGTRALVALYPHTGRTHQLRMHCAHQEGLGCPILGDELYGTKADRLYLHCDHLQLSHPVSGEKMSFNLEKPCEFQKICLSL